MLEKTILLYSPLYNFDSDAVFRFNEAAQREGIPVPLNN